MGFFLSIFSQYSYYYSLFKRIDRKLYKCKSEFQPTKMLRTREMKENRRVKDI